MLVEKNRHVENTVFCKNRQVEPEFPSYGVIGFRWREEMLGGIGILLSADLGDNNGMASLFQKGFP